MSKQTFEVARFTGFWFAPNELVIVGLDTPDGPEHPLYDERIMLPVKEELVVNIARFGIKKPVLVAKIGERALVVDGRQRVRAARAANLLLEAAGDPPLKVPVVVQKGEASTLEQIAIVCNEYSQDDSVLTKARKAQRLADRGASPAEIALIFGVSAQCLSSWARLLEADPAVLEQVEAGRLSSSAAVASLALPREEQQELAEVAAESAAPVSAAKVKRAAGSCVKPTAKLIKHLLSCDLDDQFLLGLSFATGRPSDVTEVIGLVKAVRAFEETA